MSVIPSYGNYSRSPIIIPTLNERDNVRELVALLPNTLTGLVDDDFSDGTLDVLRDLSRSDPRVRYLHRVGRRGLASAVSEGILSTSSPFVAVMDSDLQHDVTVLPTMFERLLEGDCDLVIASRFMDGGGVGGWPKSRLLLSKVAKTFADLVLASKITGPMSDFFVIRREAFDLAARRRFWAATGGMPIWCFRPTWGGGLVTHHGGALSSPRAQYGTIDVITRYTKGGRKLDVRRCMPGAGLSR